MENYNKERRYQWIITIILTITLTTIGFLSGMLFQAERMSKQVTENKVKVERIERDIAGINDKLDRFFFAEAHK